MLYLSTRGHPDRKHFCDILLEGLAPDGGLYLPEHYPQIDDAKLTQLRKAYHEQGYAELAFQILSLYIDDIPAADLKALCAKTYTAEVFGTGILGGLSAYPLAVLFLGKNAGQMAFYVYVVPFLVSTVGGSLLSGMLLYALQRVRALAYVQKKLGA